MCEYLNKKVWVYYNLHKKIFSIKYKNKVVKHSNFIVLNNVKFIVRKSGNNKVRKDKQKNVHAFVCGTLIEIGELVKNITQYSKIIGYNPYKFTTFVDIVTCDPIHNSMEVILNNDKNKIYVIK